MSPLPPPRVTLKQIAAKAGVHVSTAWRALKNDTYVDPARREHIRKIADEMGYTPDPMLTALSHYRRKQHPPAYQSTFAWINNLPDPHPRRKYPHLQAYFEGASAHAAAMGFKVEEFWMREPGMTAKRAREVLLARNIRGLILAPQQTANTSLKFDFTGFASVGLGYSMVSPRLHVVVNHQHGSTLLCLRELARLGHRRIGMVSTTETLRRAEHNFESPYFLFQGMQPEDGRIPPFIIEGRDEPENVIPWAERFLSWYRQYKPTAIISSVEEISGWLKKNGAEIPGNVSLATLSHIHENTWSGVDQQEKIIGARAVELLISLFHSGERGIPESPVRLNIEGRWVDAGTVRKIGPAADDLIARLT